MLFFWIQKINLNSKSGLLMIAGFGSLIFFSSFHIVNAQTAIYRSVGPSATSALTTGASNALTISGTTATFNSALADNIGVGDAIQYDSDGNNSIDAIAFIHGRTSSTVYTVANAAGGTPTSVTGDNDWSIYRAYISLLNAEGGTENTGIDNAVEGFDTWSGGKDLTSSNELWNITLYANGTTADPTVTTMVVDGWTMSSTQYMNIYTPVLSSEVGVSQRHQGVFSTNYYYMSNTVSLIALRDDFVRITGIQLSLNTVGTGGTTAFSIGDNAFAASTHFSENIVRGPGSAAPNASAIILGTNSSNTQQIWNNIIYNFASEGIRYSTLSANAYVYNNTVYNCGIGMRGNVNRFVAKNNIVQNCTTGYLGTFQAGSTNNVSDDGTHPGGSGRTGSVMFVDEAGANFHLSSGDTIARNYGADLSADSNLAITTDIDRDTRVTPWDMGADETASVTRAAVKIRGGVNIRGGVKFR